MKIKHAFWISAATLGFTVIFHLVWTKAWQRLDIDTDWAEKVVSTSREVISKLNDYREEHGHFPESLNQLKADYQSPPGFEQPKQDAVWQYQPIGVDDFQLEVAGKSWVSSYDAMVYRSSGSYPDSWFHPFDSCHAKQIGGWWYITGFSSLKKN